MRADSQKLETTLANRRVAVIAIGGSAGAIELLTKALPGLPAEFPFGILCAVHIPHDHPSLLADVFRAHCACPVREPEAGETMLAGHLYVAPPDYHMSLEVDGTISLSTEEPVHYSRPSVDVLFESVAAARGERALGILLTGANQDGARGLAEIKAAGGLTVVENPETAKFKDMPRSALALHAPDLVIAGEELKSLFALVSSTGIQLGWSHP